jgi:hypothetical protein
MGVLARFRIGVDLVDAVVLVGLPVPATAPAPFRLLTGVVAPGTARVVGGLSLAMASLSSAVPWSALRVVSGGLVPGLSAVVLSSVRTAPGVVRSPG